MFVSTQGHVRGSIKPNGDPLFNPTSSIRQKMFSMTEIKPTSQSAGFRAGATTPQIVCKKSLPFDFYPPIPKLKRFKKKNKCEEKKVRKMRSVIDVDKVTYEEILDDLLKVERKADKYNHLTMRQLERSLKRNLKNKDKFFAEVYQHPAHLEKPDDKEYYLHARVDKLDDLEDDEIEEEYEEDPKNRNLEPLDNVEFASQTLGAEECEKK